MSKARADGGAGAAAEPGLAVTGPGGADGLDVAVATADGAAPQPATVASAITVSTTARGDAIPAV